MSREKNLAKNTLIYIIGNLTSKVLSFVLLPLYTHYLMVSELGYYDAVIGTVSIIVPIITLQIADSMYRYLLDAKTEDDIRSSITNSLFVVISGLLIFTFAYIVFIQFKHFTFAYLILLYIIGTVLFGVYQQIARGVKRNVVYASSGVIFTATTLILNVVFIIFFNMKVDALLVSGILASLIVVVYIELRIKVIKYVFPEKIKKKAIKELVKYSVPLLPNAINWWVMSTCSRYIIILFLGLDANGIFAVSSKFPSLLVVINNVFYLAWQESAIQEYSSEDKNAFYTKMFNYYMKFQFCTLILLIPATKWVMEVMVDKSYAEAWIYVPFLYIGTLFSSFSQFYGTGYLSSKDTKGAFTTSIAGSVINLALSFSLIPIIGLQAASLANMLSFLGMWALRIRQTRKYFRISVNIKEFFSLSAISALYIVLYYTRSLILDVFLCIIAAFVFIIFNKELIQRLLGFVKNRFTANKT